MLDLEQYQIRGSTAKEIAGSAESAIREGLLDSGDPLPTVRALASALNASPATVNAAYRILRHRGLIVAEGRRGTRVAPRPPLRSPEPGRQLDYAEQPSSGLRDLAIGLPDPALLPDIGAALRRVDVEQKLRLTGLDDADPKLLALAAAAFEADGIRAEALAVVSGAFDGLERVLQAHLRPGDRVIIEDPAYTSIRDLLLALGLVAVPVEVDDFGVLPARLRHALNDGAQAIRRPSNHHRSASPESVRRRDGRRARGGAAA
jgi:DNA-binding transcriptional MocR family regulator